MRTSDFDYDLPERLIAQYPCAERSGARMMVVDRARQSIAHAHVRDLPGLLNSDDLLVMNDTRVIPARVYGHKVESGGKVEVLFLERNDAGEWQALLKASRPPREGSQFALAESRIQATVTSRNDDGSVQLDVECDGPLESVLADAGHIPLPPYIQRDDDPTDRERYQTVYARDPGAVAAPTAGLHFTPELLEDLTQHDISHCYVTLHVGWGTFRPVKVSEIDEHRVESERCEVSEAAAAAINQTRRSPGRVVAVGTTTVRTLETAALAAQHVGAFAGRSELFIRPPFEFRVVDALLTNFHLPCSSLLMLVSAFSGHEFIREVYETAVAEEYRFYSYGDCMLIL
jgi:S-adenosylmethionine:tRNA ribosyltransferase-isomerase